MSRRERFMKVFISWSGGPSREIASALRGWLQEVIQEIDPWMSASDIAKGKRWGPEISANLDESMHGLVCLTRANIGEPWLNFEAGAIAKSAGTVRVHPVLLDLSPSDITGPLAEFQATSLGDRSDVLNLAKSLNEICTKPLRDDVLARIFDRYWPDLERELGRVDFSSADSEPEAPPFVERPPGDMFGEILDRLRAIEREYSAPLERRRVMIPEPSRFDSRPQHIGEFEDWSIAFRSALEVRFSGLRIGPIRLLSDSVNIYFPEPLDPEVQKYVARHAASLLGGLRPTGIETVNVIDPRSTVIADLEGGRDARVRRISTAPHPRIDISEGLNVGNVGLVDENLLTPSSSHARRKK
jgi:hypothetical protein